MNNNKPLVFGATGRVGAELIRALGKSDKVTDEVERLLGRPPISMRQFIEDNKAVWLSTT